MKSHTLPFENRWTNGEHAWEWYCELEQLVDEVHNIGKLSSDQMLHYYNFEIANRPGYE